MVDAAVSKTARGQLLCRFESDLRHQLRWLRKPVAELCSGSTEDFESFCPGSSPGSAAKHSLPSSSVVERSAVNRLVEGSNPSSGANLFYEVPHVIDNS